MLADRIHEINGAIWLNQVDDDVAASYLGIERLALPPSESADDKEAGKGGNSSISTHTQSEIQSTQAPGSRTDPGDQNEERAKKD